MNLSDFLHFNHLCPLCGEPLSLYMQVVNSVCFRATQQASGAIRFDPYKNISYYKDVAEEYIYLFDTDNQPLFEFSSPKITQMLEDTRRISSKDVFMFYLCNPNGFKEVSDDYEISLYRGCYYRRTPMLKFEKDSSKITLKQSSTANNDIINLNEAFAFKSTTRECDKIYMIKLGYSEQNTVLYYYVVPDAERKNPKFKPKIFEKTLPLLKTRPTLDLSDRQKLISRCDGWIIMS